MSLDQTERAQFARLADVLIPASAGNSANQKNDVAGDTPRLTPDGSAPTFAEELNALPSASEADVAGKWLDAVLTARPDLAEPLERILAQTRGRDAATAVADLRRDDPPAFQILAEIVPGAYFLNPEIQRAIGYAGQAPKPIDPRADYMEDGLLESVLSRGPIYRPTPEDS